MEIGLVRKIDIDEEMQQAYLDYAMSVIVARALPDARDGLKPVHRRILYAMYDMGLRADERIARTAGLLGECRNGHESSCRRSGHKSVFHGFRPQKTGTPPRACDLGSDRAQERRRASKCAEDG